jgi:hypothetical protein
VRGRSRTTRELIVKCADAHPLGRLRAIIAVLAYVALTQVLSLGVIDFTSLGLARKRRPLFTFDASSVRRAPEKTAHLPYERVSRIDRAEGGHDGRKTGNGIPVDFFYANNPYGFLYVGDE